MTVPTIRRIVTGHDTPLLVDNAELDLHVGDVVIQRGSNHAWANCSGKTCRILVVLIGSTFEPELRDRFGASH